MYFEDACDILAGASFEVKQAMVAFLEGMIDSPVVPIDAEFTISPVVEALKDL